ncbi:response regulator [Paenibacillus sp. CF384]|uniref:response regulator n=1 Tax=Paenibacillus sp. CF384 TaxID=1884382 RepID=UPI00089A7F85|nr:response regulator [Paenibacillus sp. CF384]SDX49415.1 Two-component response regulator, YesN/AraC family, consists of REC and AraC-type DNA-binding domains [Paenibacillus sp. CF384]
MKIVLVDDERSVIKGLQHIFAKHCTDHEIVGTAQSAEEALHVLQVTKADIVITDVMMPGKNGIELTRELSTLYPYLYIVILSGHAEFEYVREAMRCGAIDYLLKPCHYQTVIDLLDKIKVKAAERETQQEKSSHKQLLANVIRGIVEVPERWAVQHDLLLAVFADLETIDARFEELVTSQLLQGNVEREAMDSMIYEGKCVVLYRGVVESATFKQLLNECRLTLRKQNRTVVAAVHRFDGGSRSIEQAYDTCLKYCEFLTFNDYSAVMDDDMYAEQVKQLEPFAVSECFSGDRFGKYYASADVKKLRPYIESILQQLHRTHSRVEPVRLKRELLSELIYLEHVIKDHGVEPFFGHQIDYNQELKRIRNFKELQGWLKTYLMSAIMCMNDETHNPHYIQTAIRYIEMNYMKDLTLKEVADAVYLNAWYFSSQFKKYTRVTFSEYINLIRIRIAKEFLRQKDLKVYQVAEMVGFQDAAYFSTVFKGIEHMSPKEFQQSFLISNDS